MHLESSSHDGCFPISKDVSQESTLTIESVFFNKYFLKVILFITKVFEKPTTYFEKMPYMIGLMLSL